MSVLLTKQTAWPFPYYEGDLADASDVPGNFKLAFVPFSENFSGTFPDTLSVKDSWQESALQGTYLFLSFDNDKDPDPIELLQGLEELRQHPARKHLRFLWIENADAESDTWRREEISVDPGTGKLGKAAFWDFRNYSLFLPEGTKIEWKTRQSKFVFTAPDQAANRFRFRGEYGSSEIGEVSPEIYLPLKGKGMSSLQYFLSFKVSNLSAPENSPVPTYQGLKELDISFRMFFRDPALPGTVDDFSLESLRYPLFNEILHAPTPTGVENFYPESLQFVVQLDWLNPLEQERSFLKISTDFPTGIPSGYRTNLGATVHLKPISNKHSLIFCSLPLHVKDTNPTPLYLCPQGNFEMKVPIYDPNSTRKSEIPHNLVCGLSGVEYIRINSTGSTQINFTPGQKAFVRNFTSTSAMRHELMELMSLQTGKRLTLVDEEDQLASSDLNPEDDFNALGFDIEKREKHSWEPIELDFFPKDYVLSDKHRDQLKGAESVDGAITTPEQYLAWASDRLRETRARDEALSLENLGIDNPGAPGIIYTSWAYVEESSGDGPVFYSQPDQAVLYKDTDLTGNDSIPQDEFLAFMEVPTYRLLSGIDEKYKKIPIFPYGGGLDGFYLEDFKQMEESVISATRQKGVQELDSQAEIKGITDPRKLPKSEVANPQGTTPQGFLITYGEDRPDLTESSFEAFERIKTLELAKGTDGNSLQLSNIERESELRATLLSNQLFMVASDPKSLAPFFEQKKSDDDKAKSDDDKDKNTVYKLDIDDWLFTMNPALWEAYDTLIVFKFHNQPMLDLAKNPFAWSQPGHFSSGGRRDETQTRDQLIELLEEAISKSQSGVLEDKEKYGKLAQAALEPAWSGILALRVPIARPPTSIQGLIAGIDPKEFFAQYIGIETTPVYPEGKLLIAQNSATFGLIDYEDNSNPPPNPSGYNFQVKKLFARFQNASLVDFSSEVALTIDKLFDEKTKLRKVTEAQKAVGGNVIIMKGTVELRDGEDVYSFRFEGDQEFELTHSNAMRLISIHSAEFLTDPAGVDADIVTSRFNLIGGIDFKPLPGFDILSFGDEDVPSPGEERLLSFSQLQIIMEVDFPPEPEVTAADVKVKRTQNTFSFDAGKMDFDLSQSKVRNNSLFAKFPLKFTGLQFSGASLDSGSEGQLFNDLGFMPVEIQGLPPDINVIPPLPPLGSPNKLTVDKDPANSDAHANSWYALTFDLDLGTAGALTEGLGMVASICAAWIPEGMQPSARNSDTRGVYVGLKLPGTSGGKREIILQDMLKLVFKKIQFVAGKNDKGEVNYLLKLKNIVLKFMVLSLPPSAQSEIIIFGDPNQQESSDGSIDADQKKQLGWYASFVKK